MRDGGDGREREKGRERNQRMHVSSRNNFVSLIELAPRPEIAQGDPPDFPIG